MVCVAQRFIGLDLVYCPIKLAFFFVKISGEDGRSRAEQLLHILRQIDQYVSSPVEYQRRRGCLAVHEMLLKFRMLCVSGYCALGCHGSCAHSKQIDHTLHGNFSNLPCNTISYEIFKRLLLLNSNHAISFV